MSIRLMGMVFESGLPTTERFVLLAMADYASDAGTAIFPSVATLSRKTGLTRRAVQLSIRKLVAGEYLILDRAGGGRNNTNLWKINITRLKGEPDSPITVEEKTEKGERGSLKGERGSLKGEQRSPEPSLTIINHQEPAAVEKKPLTAEDYKERIRTALVKGEEEHRAGAGLEVEFPPDVQVVIDKICKLWLLTPPARSAGNRNAYGYWIKTARDFISACGEFKPIEIIDEIYKGYKKEGGGWYVAGPGSLVNTARAIAGRLRTAAENGNAAPIPGGPVYEKEELSYRWNINLTEDENIALMVEHQKKISGRLE